MNSNINYILEHLMLRKMHRRRRTRQWNSVQIKREQKQTKQEVTTGMWNNKMKWMETQRRRKKGTNRTATLKWNNKITIMPSNAGWMYRFDIFMGKWQCSMLRYHIFSILHRMLRYHLLLAFAGWRYLPPIYFPVHLWLHRLSRASSDSFK